jgi:hypothetical protein
MQIDEVPQDEAFLKEGKIRDVCYVVDGEGNYTKALSKGWSPKNEAIQLAWNDIYEHAEETRKKVLEGDLSPLALYMELGIMNVQILADYTGIPKRKVKRHLKMKHFSKLDETLLNRYADALNMTAMELTDIGRIRDIVIKHEG